MPAINLTIASPVAATDLSKREIEASGRRVGGKKNTLEEPVRTLCRRIELADVLLFFYLLALIRQYSWPVSNNVLAWILTFSVALSLWCLGLTKKEEPLRGEGLSYPFYLIVALPLFVIYAIRFVFPDVSFDVLNYHIIAAERALRGYPAGPADFFPVDTPLNPLADMVTGIYRHILGYRVGTIVNYLALIWVATILVKFLRAYLKRTWLIYLAVLLIVLTETLLFEINNYMVDLLALPLLLQATYLVLYVKEPKRISYSQFYTALLLGLSVTLKVTNIIFVIPIVLVWVQRLLAGKFRLASVRLVVLSLVFIAPSLPHTIHLYGETGSPVFPFYNSFFRSPYVAFINLKLPETRLGPIGSEQALIWPLLLYSKPERISELPVYAGKIPIGFVLAFFFLPFKRVDNHIRALSFIMILGALLWSLTTGYSRYASYLELISGMLVIYLFRFLFEIPNLGDSLKRGLSLFPWVVLAVLSSFSLYYTSQYEWSLRPTLFNNHSAFLKESRFLFRDYSLRRFLPPQTSTLFDKVEVWIKSVPMMGCFEGPLKPDIPTISLRNFVTFETQEARDRFTSVVDSASNKRMFSLCYLTDIKSAVDIITQKRLGVGQITTVSVPYYSYNTVYNLALIEVLPPAAKETKGGYPSFSSGDGPLSASAFRASIASQSLPARLEAGSKATVYLTVENISTVTWPGQGSRDGAYRVNLGNHWLDGNGKVLIGDDGRTGLPFDVKPGDKVELPLTITAPRAPGDYLLEVDMVQEQVAWFGAIGSKPLRVTIRVE
jgi:hypothetical protein